MAAFFFFLFLPLLSLHAQIIVVRLARRPRQAPRFFFPFLFPSQRRRMKRREMMPRASSEERIRQSFPFLLPPFFLLLRSPTGASPRRSRGEPQRPGRDSRPSRLVFFPLFPFPFSRAARESTGRRERSSQPPVRQGSASFFSLSPSFSLSRGRPKACEREGGDREGGGVSLSAVPEESKNGRQA